MIKLRNFCAFYSTNISSPNKLTFLTACRMNAESKYRWTPVSVDSVSAVSVTRDLVALQKIGRLKKWTVRKIQNSRKPRTDHNMAKSSSPNVPSTWLVTLCPHTHTVPQTCHYSPSSILAVRISCRVIAVFVFRPHLFTIIMAPECKSIDAASASKPKRSRDVLSIGEKVRILDMMEIEKKIIRRDCQVVWQEQIFRSWSDYEQ